MALRLFMFVVDNNNGGTFASVAIFIVSLFQCLEKKP